MAAVTGIDITAPGDDFHRVRDAIGRVLGVTFEDDNEGVHTALPERLPDGRQPGLHLEDDPLDEAAVASLAVYAGEWTGEVARRIFDRLVEATSWGLVLESSGGSTAAARPTLAHSA